MKNLITIAAAAGIAVAAVLGTIFAGNGGYHIAGAAAALLCCLPFFLSFEKRAPTAGELVLAAVMTAFSAAGRFIFAPLPFFKPVSAVVTLAGRHFGAQTGFMVGALSAVISNIWFGQGPWTTFQMLCWGLIGFASGVGSRLLSRTVPLCIFGVLSGIVYSLVMDVWTVLSMSGGFSAGLWLAAAVSALPVTGIYCASNVVFLLLLNKPLGRRLERLKTKYGLFSADSGESGTE